MSRTRYPAWLVAAVALLTVLASALVARPAVAAPGQLYTNPIKSVKGADPWLVYHAGNYYLITTSWTSELTMRRSPTLAGLATAPSVQVWADGTASRCCNYIDTFVVKL